jgi:cell wall-associated NlpC family hydrolase
VSALVDAARKYLGVPFHHQGRNEHGLDCAGLIVLAYRDIGIELNDIQGYGMEPWNDGLRECVESNLTKVDGEPEPGDVLLLRWRREPQHVAIVTDKGIIHAYANVRKVVETGFSPFWRHRIVGVYRR